MNKNKDLTRAFGEVMEECRRGLGISQERLALKAEVDRSFVGKVALGSNNPSLETIFKLAGALEVSPEELIRRVRERLAGSAKG